MKRIEYGFGAAFEGLLHNHILGLQLAHTIWWHKQQQAVSGFVIHPACERLTNVDWPAINDPGALLVNTQLKLRPLCIKVRRNDVPQKMLGGVEI